MKRDLIFHRDYRYSPEQVWQALTDPKAIAEWLMDNDFKPIVGHKFQFRTKPNPGFDGVTHCEVLEVDPPKSLAYTFTGGGLDTVVRYRLEKIETGTRLYIEHTGFEGIKAVLISFLMQMGVNSIYEKKLPSLLQRLFDKS
jgi:uncharacterized protein YndB with AHSA1/START domain